MSSVARLDEAGPAAALADTAHAYVTATTVREPLYEVAARSREPNRLYVDSAFEPDAATRHGEDVQEDPLEVLRVATKTAPADLSDAFGGGVRSLESGTFIPPAWCPETFAMA